MIDIDRSVLIGRAAALAILALLLALVSPLLLAPFSTYAEKAAMIAREQSLLSQAQARLGQTVALSGTPPFIRAADRAEAFEKASAALASSVPSGSMQIVSFAEIPVQGDSRRMDISLQAKATPSGLRDFADVLSRASPPLVVTGFNIARDPGEVDAEAVRATRLDVRLTVSGVVIKETVK